MTEQEQLAELAADVLLASDLNIDSEPDGTVSMLLVIGVDGEVARRVRAACKADPAALPAITALLTSAIERGLAVVADDETWDEPTPKPLTALGLN